jgi:hypothetical protein
VFNTNRESVGPADGSYKISRTLNRKISNQSAPYGIHHDPEGLTQVVWQHFHGGVQNFHSMKLLETGVEGTPDLRRR